jgi:mercuric ion binding protein
MNKLIRAIAFVAVLGLLVAISVLSMAPAESALAAPKTVKTVTLSVPGMTCSACPITVKTALAKVEGVKKTEVSFEKKEAVVTFDETKTKVEVLTEATANAGYPSTVKQ